MREELDNYFLGELSDKEKKELFDKIESDESLKSEFVRMQHTITHTKMCPQKGDSGFAARMINDLERTIRRKQIRHIFLHTVKYAAAIALVVVGGWLYYNKEVVPERELSYMTVKVPKGQRVNMTLVDGTDVWLSPLSVLRISNGFNLEDRLVELDGEGYFIVKKDEAKPFIVRTNKHDVRVLGTRFNVFAYAASSWFETDLLDGRVEVYSINKPENAVVLNPGEKIAFENNGFVRSVSQFNNEEFLKNGVFSFNNKPFGKILEYLTLWYDIEFDIKDTVKKDLLVSGKFRQSDEVINILKALQGVYTFRYNVIDEQNIEVY